VPAPAPVLDAAPDAAPLPDPAPPLLPVSILAFISMNGPVDALPAAELLPGAPVELAPAPPAPCTQPTTVIEPC